MEVCIESMRVDENYAKKMREDLEEEKIMLEEKKK
jgi:hypothetical protein